FEKVKSGGAILADNVLWDGKVLAKSNDRDSRSMEAFNRKIQDDPRVENIILPIRDGLLMARKL
ncbi:MAG: methyltransferase, partial [Bacteroidota bacterium]